MPKQNDYTLNNEELSQVQNAMKNRYAKLAKRATENSLHLGYPPPEVAKIHQISLVV